jgi:hypothetical protein
MIILFSAVAPHPLADELLSFGLQIREAIAISEVFSLIEQHPGAPILITPDVDSERARIIQRHHSTLHLKPSATIKDVFWELSHVMPGTTKPV